MRKLVFGLALISAPLLIASSASAASIQATTTVTFDAPITFGAPFNRVFDALALDWSTSAMSGIILETELTDLTFRLLNEGSTLYTDTAIQNGVVQPIGGVPRELGNIFFAFDLDNLATGLLEWDNDADVVQENAAVGETYNVYGATDPDAPLLSIAIVDGYTEGTFTDFSIRDFTQSTQLVPEPSTLLCAALVALAGCGCRVRGRQSRGVPRLWCNGCDCASACIP